MNNRFLSSHGVDRAMMVPAAPPGGGFLFLTASQLSNLDLLCAIKSTYPQTQIIPRDPIPTDHFWQLGMGWPWYERPSK